MAISTNGRNLILKIKTKHDGLTSFSLDTHIADLLAIRLGNILSTDKDGQKLIKDWAQNIVIKKGIAKQSISRFLRDAAIDMIADNILSAKKRELDGLG